VRVSLEGGCGGAMRIRNQQQKGWLFVQGGSNMTGTNCDLFTHNQSRSYLNHLVVLLRPLLGFCQFLLSRKHPVGKREEGGCISYDVQRCAVFQLPAGVSVKYGYVIGLAAHDDACVPGTRSDRDHHGKPLRANSALHILY
jgi:hypothetical protein